MTELNINKCPPSSIRQRDREYVGIAGAGACVHVAPVMARDGRSLMPMAAVVTQAGKASFANHQIGGATWQ
jgi:hypothetical protein